MSRRKPIEEADPHAPILKVFFPHSRKDYGSARAAAAERAIKSAWPGCEIIDPRFINWKRLAKEEGDSGSADEAIVRDCNIVAGLEHNKHVGRGVFGGLSAGIRLGRATYIVRDGLLLQVSRLITVDPDDWAIRFGRVEVYPPDSGPNSGAEVTEAQEERLYPDDGDK